MSMVIDLVKICNKCKIAKPFIEYHKQLHGKFGLRGRCISCVPKPTKEQSCRSAKKYAEKNREKIREKAREKYRANPDKANQATMVSRRKHYDAYLEYSRAYEKANKEARLLKSRNYAKNNPEKVAVIAMYRRAAEKQRKPLWANTEQIKKIYLERDRLNKEAGHIAYHVDHIIPLLAKEASGLHVPENLQIVPASYNVSKRNKIMEELR